jgi:serine/threonine protein kinase/tetratricopeptide (TPR) repeat protein
MHESDDDKTQTHKVLIKGTEISHYRIINKIGAGGMGEVYLAQDTELNRKVALKFLPPHLCADEECRQRFKREAQAAAKLDHPNIIPVYEVSDFQGRPYFAMAHVEGRSLRDFATDKDLTIDQILELAIQICEGLEAAHEQGVTHRDIKPSNILIDSHGRARIVDFGLAAVKGTDQLTKTGSTMGTIGYMSPEQVRGQQVDHRSDLFSFGVVLYELITKQNPFKRDSEAATLKAVSDDFPEPIARFKTHIPEGLQVIIDKALEKDIKTRYQHADGMLSDLTRLKRSLDMSQFTGVVPVTAGRSKNVWWIATAAIIVVAIAVLMVGKPWLAGDTSNESDKIMLAVLPFENLGDPEDEYFADGTTDEITSKLASIHGLGIISRTSAMQYKNVSKSLREIGRELGVDYILEGTIRWDKTGDTDRIRITPQLIHVSDDRHLWADNYERSLTQVFAVQSDIASQIAQALNVTLLGTEQSIINDWPTNNLQAYDYYLRGRRYSDIDGQHSRAEEMFEKAIELDSTFAMAYADLSHLHSYIYWLAIDQTSHRIELAREYADKALRLSPNLPESHLALGYYYYYSGRDYERSLEEFGKALESQPNNSDVLAAVAYVKRRQGKWQEAYELLRESLRLDPTSRTKFNNFAQICGALGRRQEILEQCDRIIALDPEASAAWVYKVFSIGLYLGDTARAREVLAEAESIVGFSNMPYNLWHFDISVGDYESALRRDARKIDTISSARDSGDYYMHYASTYHFAGKMNLSYGYFDSARVCLERALQSGSVVGNYPETRIQLAKVYASLGRKEEALELGRKALEELPRTKDAYSGINLLTDFCIVNIAAGEYEAAIAIIDTLLSMPSGLNVQFVKLHPGFNPLRDNAGFKALMEKYENGYGI